DRINDVGDGSGDAKGAKSDVGSMGDAEVDGSSSTDSRSGGARDVSGDAFHWSGDIDEDGHGIGNVEF
ncbi:unnamed protein product, partial [Ilex paraguariensis]